MTLPEFLLARIAEDEESASSERRMCERITPERLRAECKAKRRIMNAHEGSDSLVARWYLGVLALPYADHPDYRDEWKP